MPKIACPCGAVLELSPIPDAGWITVRDADYERMVAAEQQAPFVERITTPLQGRLYECPVCHRLHWQREGSRQYAVYLPDAPAI